MWSVCSSVFGIPLSNGVRLHGAGGHICFKERILKMNLTKSFISFILNVFKDFFLSDFYFPIFFMILFVSVSLFLFFLFFRK